MSGRREGLVDRRKCVGLSQEALAERLGVDRTTVGRWESADTEPRPWLRPRLARALGVSLDDLDRLLVAREEAEPGGTADTAMRTRAPRLATIEIIRNHLAGYGHLVGGELRPWPLPQLRNASVEVHRAYQAAQYARAAAALPKILTAADAYGAYTHRDGRATQLARSIAYAVAAKLLTKIGEGQLAWLAADRASHAAMESGSMIAQGLAAYQVACALLRNEQRDDAEQVAVRCAERLMPHTASGDPDAVSLTGALWLISAVIAGRMGDRTTSTARLATAGKLSEHLGPDANHVWTAFGPINVRIHQASCMAEFGDPSAVLHAVSEIDVGAMPAGLRGRRARVFLDVAWAQTQARRDTEAVVHLQQVEGIAPELLRYDTTARRLVCELLERSRRPMPSLVALASRAGIVA